MTLVTEGTATEETGAVLTAAIVELAKAPELTAATEVATEGAAVVSVKGQTVVVS